MTISKAPDSEDFSKLAHRCRATAIAVEQENQAKLKQSIASKIAYLEVELQAAAKLGKFEYIFELGHNLVLGKDQLKLWLNQQGFEVSTDLFGNPIITGGIRFRISW